MPSTKLSTCRRKMRFASMDDARNAARDAAIVLRPYRCDRCHQYHLTSRTKGKRPINAAAIAATSLGGGAV